MTRNKPRLLLGLYVRPKHLDSYHYALFISPKPSDHQASLSATKFHALNPLQNISGELSQPWSYERTQIADVNNERRLLVLIVIAKVLDEAAVVRRLETVPVYQRDDLGRAKAQAFDCAIWVREAFDVLQSSTAIACLGSSDVIEVAALEYVTRKKRAGRWTEPARPDVPIFDILQRRELAD